MIQRHNVVSFQGESGVLLITIRVHISVVGIQSVNWFRLNTS